MWSRIYCDGIFYLLRCRREKDDFNILLTDCSQLWRRHLSYLDLIRRCKDLNPLIETKDDKYVNLVLDMFKTQNPETCLITMNGSSKLLQMKSKLFGFLFNFEIDLNAADAHVFQVEVVNPLLFLIHEMQWKNKILVDLLKKKDIEINQYQLEGAQLFRTSVVTKPFQECGFEDECASASIEKNICQEPLGVMDDALLKLWSSVENKVADVNKENMNMKSEPSPLPKQDEISLSFEPPPIEKGENTEVQIQNNLVDPVVNNIKEEKKTKSFEVPDRKRKKTSKKLFNL